MQIKNAVSAEEKDDLDRLLWSVLWEPLGLPRDVRKTFALNSPEIDLIAVDSGVLAGGLVANRLSGDEIEIRHLAVRAEYRGRSVGKRLVKALIKRAPANGTVQTYARNTSLGFFARLGFKPAGECLEHPDFAARGISFQKMRLKVP